MNWGSSPWGVLTGLSKSEIRFSGLELAQPEFDFTHAISKTGCSPGLLRATRIDLLN